MKKRLNFILILLSVALLSGCSFGGSSSVQSDPTAAVSKTGAIWKSTDGGKTWDVMSDQKIDISKVEVLSIAINPNNSDNVFVGLKGQGILKTTDGGTSWSYLKFQAEKIYGLAINPQSPNIIYASGVWQNRAKIWKSSNNGDNWEEIYTAPAEGPLVISLVLDNKNPEKLYISTSDNQILRSSDEGITWSKIFEPKMAITRIAIAKNNSNNVYLLSDSGNLFRSQNGEATFENITQKISDSLKINADFGELETDQNSVIYLGGENGLIRSKDAGVKWENISLINDTQNFPIRSLAINPQDNNEIIYGSAYAAYKSINGGQSWTTSQFNVSNVIRVIEYSSQNPSVIYLGVGSLN